MLSARPTLLHINTSATLGGAELYTHFFAAALQRAGWNNEICISGDATLWPDLDRREAFAHQYRVLGEPGRELPVDSIVFIHAPDAQQLGEIVVRPRLTVGLAHQALYSAAMPKYYREADVLLSVSAHVTETLSKAGITRVHKQPLLGIASLPKASSAAVITRGPLCEWDRRKLRDRTLALMEPIANAFSKKPAFTRRPGLTLGIVSRLAPLKQFPALFHVIAPILAEHEDVHLEVFGSAIGYAPLRDLRAALAPLGGRVRWWGFQSDVAAAYAGLDYLLTGLPEREALGLNVIEAQYCGVPVLAPRAPPFTETMIEGETGYMFTDPREDGGEDFRRVLAEAKRRRPDPRLAHVHLAQFSRPAFDARVNQVVEELVSNPGVWRRND